MKGVACLLALCFTLVASHAVAQQAEIIRLAVIGDSYTVGYGDNCPIYGNKCSNLPTVGWYISPAAAPRMQPCNTFFGWPGRLISQLTTPARNVTLVAYCAARSKTTKEMFDAHCGKIVAAAAPTHTILFSGLNDGGANFRKDTEYWAGQIGGEFVQNGGVGKTIYLQGNGPVNPVYWQQNFQWSKFMAGVNTPCAPPGSPVPAGHPDPLGYGTIAINLAKIIQW